jgi:multidrug efflux pump subunit AcrB
MILVFLGSFRATLAVFFSIPLSVLAAFIAMSLGGGSVNSMVLGGLALAFSRLIDNSVVVLENIYRHLEIGEAPAVAAGRGGQEVALPVLAATLTTVVVFFPVTFLYGVSKFLFSALALALVLSLFASYVVAMTVVPLFCARFLKPSHYLTPSDEVPVEVEKGRRGMTLGARFNVWFNDRFEAFLKVYDKLVAIVLRRPGPHDFGFCSNLRSQSGPLHQAGTLLFSPNRRGAIRHQLKSPKRDPALDNRRRGLPSSRRWCGKLFLPPTWE